MCLSLRNTHSVNDRSLKLFFSKLDVIELGVDAGLERVVHAIHL